MNKASPQIESQLDKLAELVCEQLTGKSHALEERGEALLKALLMGGYVRTHGSDITAPIESRAKNLCRDKSMHRGGALSGITSNLQSKFDKLVQWESRQVEDKAKPKSANISANTDA